MMKHLKGFVHVHSCFSYDGKNNIDDWVQFLKARKYDFVCFTEHDDNFNQQKMDELVAVCRELSSPTFHAMPGLEFRCNNTVHILGIGINEYEDIKDPIEAARFIKERSGIAVIAHPRGYDSNISHHLLKCVDGVEIWNASKDGRFFPNADCLRLFQRYRSVNPALSPVGGADCHDIDSYFPLDIYVDSNSIGIDINNIERIQGQFYTLHFKDGTPLASGRMLNLLCWVYDFAKKVKKQFVQ